MTKTGMTTAEVCAELTKTLNTSIDYCNSVLLQNRDGFVAALADGTLAIVESGDDFRLGGLENAKLFRDRRVAVKVAASWNSLEKVKGTLSEVVITTLVEAASARKESCQDLLKQLEAATK